MKTPFAQIPCSGSKFLNHPPRLIRSETMPKTRTTTFYLYAHFADTFMNGGFDHLSDKDLSEFRELRDQLDRELGNNWHCVDVQDECDGYPELSTERLFGRIAEFTFEYSIE
jgi:succinate dehydrogenase flavin-adding protein (antitoxin of CptAB toxin-antitoxin module)